MTDYTSIETTFRAVELIENQAALIKAQRDSIKRAMTIANVQSDLLQKQAAKIDELTATIKWLHEQIQEMDAEYNEH